MASTDKGEAFPERLRNLTERAKVLGCAWSCDLPAMSAGPDANGPPAWVPLTADAKSFTVAANTQQLQPNNKERPNEFALLNKLRLMTRSEGVLPSLGMDGDASSQGYPPGSHLSSTTIGPATVFTHPTVRTQHIRNPVTRPSTVAIQVPGHSTVAMQVPGHSTVSMQVPGQRGYGARVLVPAQQGSASSPSLFPHGLLPQRPPGRDKQLLEYDQRPTKQLTGQMPARTRLQLVCSWW